MVGGTSIYVENETKVDYCKDVLSASKQLKRKVAALGINYIDATKDVRTSDMRVLVGYMEHQLCVSYDIVLLLNLFYLFFLISVLMFV